MHDPSLATSAAVLPQWFNTEVFSIQDTDVTLRGLVVFAVTVGISAGLGRLMRRVVVKLVARRSPKAEGTGYAMGRITQYLFLFVGAFVGLENMGVSMTTLAAMGAVLGVGLGFALQDIARNLVSGLILLLERPIEKGDVVIVGGTYGVVDEVGSRATRVMTFDNISMVVPNSKLITEIVENRSQPTSTYRVRISVGVAYGSDVRLVERLLLEVSAAHKEVLNDPAPEVFFMDFGDSGLLFDLAVWLDDPQLALRIKSGIRFDIDAAFRANNITIPFPQRDVHMVASSKPIPAKR